MNFKHFGHLQPFGHPRDIFFTGEGEPSEVLGWGLVYSQPVPHAMFFPCFRLVHAVCWSCSIRGPAACTWQKKRGERDPIAPQSAMQKSTADAPPARWVRPGSTGANFVKNRRKTRSWGRDWAIFLAPAIKRGSGGLLGTRLEMLLHNISSGIQIFEECINI